MSTIKVSKIEPVTSGGDCIVKATNFIGHKNIIINGGMIVAQRFGTTARSVSGWESVDRWNNQWSGHNENCTQQQVSLSTSDTGPFEKGFRKALQITNGNQTSADAGDYMRIYQPIEAQNLSQSGWNYKSATSYLTLSFWVKSSVAQTFYGYLLTDDGTAQRYAFSTGSLSADTWTKVTKTIPGLANGNIDINTDNGVGMYLFIHPFAGTSTTDDGVSLTGWEAHNSSARMPDFTTTWWLADNATFAVTGVQLEVGDVVTDFEHRTYGDELAKCQRYYIQYDTTSGRVWQGRMNGSGNSDGYIDFPVDMRTEPTGSYNFDSAVCEQGSSALTVDGLNASGYGNRVGWGRCELSSSGTSGQATYMRLTGESKLRYSAEL